MPDGAFTADLSPAAARRNTPALAAGAPTGAAASGVAERRLVGDSRSARGCPDPAMRARLPPLRGGRRGSVSLLLQLLLLLQVLPVLADVLRLRLDKGA